MDFSSLIEDVIKTQGSVLDVDLWMKLTDDVFLGRHVRFLYTTYTEYHNAACHLCQFYKEMANYYSDSTSQRCAAHWRG